MVNTQKRPNPDEKRSLFATIRPLFAPWTIRKSFGFDDNDIKHIHANLARSLSVVSFIGGIVSLLFGLFFIICINLRIWGFQNVNAYMHAGAYCLAVINTVGITLIGIDFFAKKEYPHLRFAGDLVFHLSLLASYIFFFLSDLTNGYLSASETITPAVGLLFILAICQSGYLLSSFLLNLGTGIATIVLCIVGLNNYGMRAMEQYMFFVLGFWAICYFLYSAFVFVEAQRYYIENSNVDLFSRSTHDPLTGAHNRAGLRFYLNDRLDSWIGKRADVLVAMFDIDDFKRYNDTFGHLKGDEVLISIVKAIETSPDIHHVHLYRYGGEEFLVIRSKVDEEEAKSILEAIRKAVENLRFPFPGGEEGQYLTISLGGALWTIQPGYSFHNQIEAADKALYEAKFGGKNRYVLHSILDEKTPEEQDAEEDNDEKKE